jgi:phage terminase large subunit-like protein
VVTVADSLLEVKLSRLRKLRDLQAAQHRQETGDAAKRPWPLIARPEQLEPPGRWFVWLILAGRGWGKSRTAAEFVAKKARLFPGCRIALVASTVADTRDTMVEGESGLLTCLTAAELRGGSVDGAWNRSLGELYLANGSQFKTFSSEKPRKLRGPQFHFAWADESCFWTDAHKGTLVDSTWSNLTIATRLPRRPSWSADYRTQIVVATTPRPVALLRVTDPQLAAPGLMQRSNVIITRGRTVDNLANLSEEYKANVVAPLLGTQLGRQELDAEILESRDGALWHRDWLDAGRLASNVPLDLTRVVVGVDPAVTDGETSDLTGIVVVGADRTGHGYVLGDYTLRGTPLEAMRKVVWAYEHHEADRVVAEVNNGGDYIGTVLHTVNPNVPFRSVRASRGKETRAEPVSSLYQQNRAHHVGSFPHLEDEMCTWAPGDDESPDRVDALVWAFADLADLVGGSWRDAYGVTKCEACTRPFLLTVNGVTRDRCPHCRTPLPRPDAAA